MSGDLWVIAPLACLALGAFGVYLVARLITYRNDVLASLTTLCFAAALGSLWPVFRRVCLDWGAHGAAGFASLPIWTRSATSSAFFRAEPGALAIAGIALGLAALVALYSGRYLALDQRYETYYPLLLLLVTGLVGMVLATDLFNLYLFCELMGITSYVLVAFRRRTDTAIEAGFKYLVMGSVGTVMFLMGVSFVFRGTGSLDVWQPEAGAPGTWTRLGIAFFLVGLGLKSAIVPLHTWLPDAHGRAPSSISAMLSGIVIQSAFYVLVKTVLGVGFSAQSLGTLLVVLSLVSMTVGNAMALVQTMGKRLLAYSSIANMGYVMFAIGVGLRVDQPVAIQMGFFLLLAHAVMKGLAFLCKGACHFYEDATTIAQLRGTSKRLPLVAVTFTTALAGLSSIPPLSGFAAKWFILRAVLDQADALTYLGVAVFLLNSVLALGYYLPLIATLFAPPDTPPPARVHVSRWMAAPMLLMAGLVLAMGLSPEPWLQWMLGPGVYLLHLGGG